MRRPLGAKDAEQLRRQHDIAVTASLALLALQLSFFEQRDMTSITAAYFGSIAPTGSTA
jgi:hypothetical protein